MKFLVIALALVLCVSVSAREGYEPITPESLPNLEDVMTIGTKAALSEAFKNNQIRPAVYHIDRLLSLSQQVTEGFINYEVIVEVSDKYDPRYKAVVETIVEQDTFFDRYAIRAHFVTVQ